MCSNLVDGDTRSVRVCRMQTVDAVDGEIRFRTAWGNANRWVFISREIVSADAGRDLSRDDAVQFVRDHFERYVAEAREQHGENNAVQTVALTRTQS